MLVAHAVLVPAEAADALASAVRTVLAGREPPAGLRTLLAELEATARDYRRREATTAEAEPRTVGTAEAAAVLGITRRSVQRLHERGRLPGRRVRGRLLFDLDDVESLRRPT